MPNASFPMQALKFCCIQINNVAAAVINDCVNSYNKSGISPKCGSFHTFTMLAS